MAGFSWWDGAARQPVTPKGWWDGAAVQPIAGWSEHGATPAPVEHSVYGAAAPSGTWAIYSDGTSISLGETFYRYGDAAVTAGAQCVGGRVWTPDGEYWGSDMQIMGWSDMRDDYTSSFSAPGRSVVVPINKGGWTEARWDPFPLPEPGYRWMIGYTIPGAPNLYIASTDQGGEYQAATDGLPIVKSESYEPDAPWGPVHRGYFQITGQGMAFQGSNVSYGVDTIVTMG